MAFAGMFIGTVALIIIVTVLGIGLINLIVGIILDIIWAVKKKNAKKPLKVFACIFSILGFMGFILPILSVIILSFIVSVQSDIEFNNKMDTFPVHVEMGNEYIYSHSSYEIDGVNYVRVQVERMTPYSDKIVKEPYVAFVSSNKSIVEGYKVANDKNFNLLLVGDNKFYVEEDQYDDLVNYYTNEVELTNGYVSYTDKDNENRYITEEITFDSDEIKKVLDESSGTNYDYSKANGNLYMEFESKDGLLRKHMYLDITDDGLACSHVSGGGNTRGHLFEQESASFLINLIKSQTNCYLDFNQ